MSRRDDLVPEDGHRRRRAWRRAKAAFGSEELAEQLTRLEGCQLGCPRLLLCACVDRFLRLGPESRRAAAAAYLASTAFPAAEVIPTTERSPEEAMACESAFLEAMGRVMAQAAG